MPRASNLVRPVKLDADRSVMRKMMVKVRREVERGHEVDVAAVGRAKTIRLRHTPIKSKF